MPSSESSRAIEYERRVSHAFHIWHTNRNQRALVDLASWLGCPYTPVDLPATLGLEVDEALILKTWKKLLKKEMPLSGAASFINGHLLHGLLHNNRWRVLLKSERDAHLFVALVTRYFANCTDGRSIMAPYEVEMHSIILDKLSVAVATWLSPVVLPREFYVRNLLKALFGEPWCVLVADSRPAGVSMDHLILHERPPFLPRLLKVDRVQAARDLPVLSCCQTTL
jgi:hypothetical protein